ncbi:MAG: arsenate reductase ArsC [Planctomycetota bacterium]|jgi:arsenate reductase
MSGAEKKVKVLFVCTGNSCRSQMAEGWTRHLKSDAIEAYSAGISPGRVSSMATRVMAEAGVDISTQTSKHVDGLLGIDFDYVVTLCDNAREQCPVLGSKAGRIHRSFEDPTFMPGSEEDIIAAFRKTRDAIRAFVETMPESLHSKNS